MLGIKKIDGIVFKAFIGPLFFTFIISEFIFLMQFLWKYIDDLVGKGLEFNIIIQLLGLFSFKVVPLALPLSILLSSTMTMGNFGENNELVACKSSGISTLRAMGSLIVFVGCLSIGAYFFSNQVLPFTNLKFISLLSDIRRHKPALDIREGVFYKGINGYTLKIGRKSPNNTSIYDIIVYNHTSGFGNDNVIMAEKGELQLSADQRYMIFELYNGRQYQDTRKRGKEFEKVYEQNVVEFKYYRKVFDLKEFKLNRSDGTLYKGYQELLNSQQLRTEIDSMNREINKVSDAMNDYNRNYITYSKSKEYFDYKIPSDTVFIDTLNVEHILDGSSVTEPLVNSALLNLSSLQSYSDMQKTDRDLKIFYIQKFKVELNKKFMLSFACIILLLIGGSMGAIVRKGGLGMPVLISTCFFMLFHVLNMTGDKLAYNEVISAALGAWLPTIVLLPISLWLAYEATNDSNMLKKETYNKIYYFFRDLIYKIFRIKRA